MPLDEYSSGLVDLARFQAQQRFLQGQLAQQEQAARDAATAHLAGQKEILTATQLQQSQIETARETARVKLQTQEDIAAETRTQIRAGTDIKKAEIAAAAAEKARQGVAKETAKQHLVEKFQEFNIPMKKGESDDDYIARAQEIAPVQLGGQLASLDTDYRTAVAKHDKLLADAAASYPARLSEATWQHAKALIPDSVQKKQLDQMAPLQRETAMALLGDKGKEIRNTYDASRAQAEKTVPREDDETYNKRLQLANEAKQLQDELARKKADIRYASAIPEFLKQIKSPGAAAPDIDFSRMSSPPGTARPGAGAPAAVGAPGARALPGEIAPPGARSVVPPPTAAEVYGPEGSGFGETYRQYGAPAAVLSLPYQAGAKLGSLMEYPAAAVTENIPRKGYRTGQFLLGQKLFPESGVPTSDEIANPQGMDIYQNYLGIPKGFNVTAAGRPPTPAEIATFRAGVPARRTVIAPPEIYGVPGGLIGPPQAPPPSPFSDAYQAQTLRSAIRAHPRTNNSPMLDQQLNAMNLPQLQQTLDQLGPAEIMR
jgi:hypothetical protein